MKKRDRKSRLSLTILFSIVILIFIIVTLGSAIGIGFLLIKLDVIRFRDDNDITLTKVLGLLSASSFVIGAILATFAGKIPMKPVNKIISQLNKLASGDFSARLSFRGPLGNLPAIKDACSSFNKMAQELEATEMLRSDFINNFSHEFKTPIVSIAGFAKLLKRGNLSEAQKAEYISIIEEESLRLSNLATNMLNLTKYENQNILTDITQYNLSEQIRSCILTLEGKWSKKQIEFNLNFDEHTISANKDMLKHTWINLIDNAIKFSEEGQTVTIDISEEPNRLLVSVINLAEDITPEKQERIFNKFYQADESHASEGNGIGLAVVKSVVKLHNGKVSVSSANGIITFLVSLPKAQ